MTRRLLLTIAVVLGSAMAPVAQEVSLEYRVKAAYLYNFIRFVEWPEPPGERFTICVAGQNPFGTVLTNLVSDERFRGVPIEVRVIPGPQPPCHVIFAPRTSKIPAYLREAAGTPTLTVGETPGFLAQGGMIQFFLDGVHVRFEINRTAAERARLRISSRLLQLSRPADSEAEKR